MIEVSLVLNPAHSTLEEVVVQGHSGDAGNSVVCAAVTALVRTAARTVESYGKFTLEGNADAPGKLRFKITGEENTESGDFIWLMGVTDYLAMGIRDIEREHPTECKMEILSGGKRYGT
ncbi:MAG: ribosomal-processing cysteine protease Prp [Spirochaetia bacterium]